MREARQVPLAAVALMLLMSAAGSVRAQVQTEDLARSRTRAVRAQQQFESYRRRQLPVTGGRSAASDCDVRIGRFCYWHDNAEDPPPEPERVAAARAAFLRALDSLGTITARDDWMVGQRVRYLVEANRSADGLRVAEACAATAWWCSALRGFARHALGAYEAADRAYSAAIAAMPAAQRCRWTDLRDLLPDGIRAAYRAVPCERRDSLNARLWWLADPRWASAGNDLRTEVYARLTMAELVQQARSAHDLSWGDDMAKLMLRYGWPTAWSRSPPSTTDAARISVVGHEPSPSYDFMPDEHAWRDPLSAEAESWRPTAERPLTRYAPAYGQRYRDIDPQVVWFARGDSAAVVVAYDVSRERDTVFTRDTVQAAVVISRGPSDMAIAQTAAGRRGPFVVATGWAPALASVEIVDSATRAFARARWALKPPVQGMVSDLLLFDGTGGLPPTFDAAVERALGSHTVARAAPFGVYWELYGALARAQAINYNVTVERIGAGWLRRLAERARLLDRPQPVRLGFNDHAGARREVTARSLLIDVSHIPPGRYRLTLTVSAEGRVAETRREVDVR